MQLSAEDAQTAYRLHWALMAYANRHARVVPRDVAPEDIGREPMERVARLHEAWQKNPHILEEFLAKNPADLSPDELAIVASWRHRVSGTFVILRYLKPYAVFMSQEKEPHLYGVQSLHDSFQALMHGASPPIMVRATLLPFRGRIIYDGILGLYSITFGPGLRARFARDYKRLRGREGIIEQLVGADGRPEIRTSLSRPALRKPAPDWRPILAEISGQAASIRRTDTRLQSAAVALLRASVSLCQAAFEEGDADVAAAGKVRAARRALSRLLNILYGDEED
ncbi:MAG: hypothetical protein ACUVYA_19230 [Planctomycetota bacterium]